MALNFPSSPTIGQIYTDSVSGFSYEWNGTVWISFSAASSSQIKPLDDISGSFNNVTQTFALTSNSVSITPPTAQSLIINLGGVIQDATDDYSVTSSNITFSTPPASGLSFSGVSLGPAIPINTIPDGTVTDGSLRISTTAVVGSATTFTEDLVVSGDARITGILTVGTGSITLNGSTNQVNVGTGITINHINGVQVGGNTLRSTGLTLNSLNVTGVSTFTNDVTIADKIIHSGDTNTAIRFPAADTFTVETAGSERLRITSAGLVGIGASSPGAGLHVVSEGTGNSRSLQIAPPSTAQGNRATLSLYSTFEGTGDNGARRTADIQVGFNGGAWGTEFLSFNVGNNGSSNDAQAVTSEKVRIDSSGRLLVGVSTSITTLIQPQLQIHGTGENAFISANRWSNDSSATALIMGKSRGAAVATRGAVSNNDSLGEIIFTGDNGSTFSSGASIICQVDGVVSGGGAADMPGRLMFATTADGSATLVERMRISSTGRTSITHGNLTDVLAVDSTNASFASAVFVTATARGAGTSCFYLYGQANSVNNFIVYNNGNIVNTNNSYGALSDIKLKENIVDATSQWSDIKNLQVRKYNFKEETGQQTHTQIGLVAQEVELVSPGLVIETNDRDEDGNDLGTVTKSVSYSVLYMKAVKALQEAMERIETLEQRLNDAGIN